MHTCISDDSPRGKTVRFRTARARKGMKNGGSNSKIPKSEKKKNVREYKYEEK